jgi:hypothetical protein
MGISSRRRFLIPKNFKTHLSERIADKADALTVFARIGKEDVCHALARRA